MKAVIVKLSSLGDIVQALPVAAYLKSRGYSVTWVVDRQCASLVNTCPFVDEVIEIPIRLWKKKSPSLKELKEQYAKLRKHSYDVAFDVQGNIKSALIMASLKANNKVGIGKKSISEWPALLAAHFHFDPDFGQSARQEYIQIVQKYYADLEPFDAPPILLEAPLTEQFFTSAHKKIIVAAGSQWMNKELKWETLLALIQKLDKALPIEWLFTSGSEREKGYAETLSQSVKMAKKLHLSPLPRLQAIMKQSSAVLAVDSLPLHLAGLAGVPTFAFFGPSSAAKYAPGHFIQGPCPYGVTFSRRCPRLRTCPTSACIKDLGLLPLFEEVLAFLHSLPC